MVTYLIYCVGNGFKIFQSWDGTTHGISKLLRKTLNANCLAATNSIARDFVFGVKVGYIKPSCIPTAGGVLTKKSLCTLRSERHLLESEQVDSLCSMSTVPEIEAAIQKLPPAELRELMTWIEDYAAAIGGSEALFAMYDAEEKENRAESQAR